MIFNHGITRGPADAHSVEDADQMEVVGGLDGRWAMLSNY